MQETFLLQTTFFDNTEATNSFKEMKKLVTQISTGSENQTLKKVQWNCTLPKNVCSHFWELRLGFFIIFKTQWLCPYCSKKSRTNYKNIKINLIFKIFLSLKANSITFCNLYQFWSLYREKSCQNFQKNGKENKQFSQLSTWENEFFVLTCFHAIMLIFIWLSPSQYTNLWN